MIPPHARGWLAIAAGGILLGCATISPPPEDVPKNTDKVTLEKIHQATLQIDRNVQNYLSIKQVNVKKPTVYEAPEDGPLAQRINFFWSGPVEPALRSLAQQADFRLQIVGRPPLQPKVVMIDGRDMAIFDVIQSIGWQVGENVGVGIKQKKRTIVLIYMNRGPTG